MTIKVLADSAKEKGRLLSQLVKQLLDELGYDDFRVRVAAAGTDLEVKAKHRATQAPIQCKVRALPREIGPDELKRFLSAYSQSKRKDRRFVGLFLAFCGLVCKFGGEREGRVPRLRPGEDPGASPPCTADRTARSG